MSTSIEESSLLGGEGVSKEAEALLVFGVNWGFWIKRVCKSNNDKGQHGCRLLVHCIGTRGSSSKALLVIFCFLVYFYTSICNGSEDILIVFKQSCYEIISKYSMIKLLKFHVIGIKLITELFRWETHHADTKASSWGLRQSFFLLFPMTNWGIVNLLKLSNGGSWIGHARRSRCFVHRDNERSSGIKACFFNCLSQPPLPQSARKPVPPDGNHMSQEDETPDRIHSEGIRPDWVWTKVRGPY